MVKLKKGTVAVAVKQLKLSGLSEGDAVWWHVYEQNEWHSPKWG
ncbi:MAG: hypothetical protein V8Q65_00125 [Bacteroidaceae bacterium]